jgi:malate dehydrogenase (oxaloacetate-decarboxylating)(NADP+)
VLGFPLIFRGALDVRASCINEEMKLAAVKALARLAQEEVPDSVSKAYGNVKFSFGRDYIIPKPFDPRVLLHVAPAIAQAAMDSGVARLPLEDMAKYIEHLESTQGTSKEIMRYIINKAKTDPKRVVFPEGDNEKMLRAAQTLMDEGIAKPILIGNSIKIRNKIDELGLSLDEVQIVDTENSKYTEPYSQELYRLRQPKGITESEARRIIRRKSRNHFGAMMVRMGDADAMVSGIEAQYPETIRPALEVIGKQPNLSWVHGMYMMVFKKGVYFMADTTVDIDPSAEELAETAILAAQNVRGFDIDPRVAMLSFSNFGSVQHPNSAKVRRAVEIVKEREPDLIIDGEMQADTAVVQELLDHYSFSKLKNTANVLIFPDLNSGNIAYKLLARLGGAEAIGPILMGMEKPVHVLQRGDDVNDIVNMAAIAVVDAQNRS